MKKPKINTHGTTPESSNTAGQDSSSSLANETFNTSNTNADTLISTTPANIPPNYTNYIHEIFNQGSNRTKKKIL